MTPDDIELTIDGTDVTVQRREKKASDDEWLYVHVYDRHDEFGRDYSQYTFVITDDAERRRCRFVKRDDACVPPSIAVQAVNKAGFLIEGLDDLDHKTYERLSRQLERFMPDKERAPAMYHMGLTSLSALRFVTQFEDTILNDPESEWYDDEHGFYTALANDLGGQQDAVLQFAAKNPVAAHLFRFVVAASHGVDPLGTVLNDPDPPLDPDGLLIEDALDIFDASKRIARGELKTPDVREELAERYGR